MGIKEKKKKFLKIFVIYFTILFAFVLVRIAANLGAFNGIENEYVLDLVSTLIIQIGILFLIPITLYMCFFKKGPKQVFNDFGYKKLNFKSILICFGIGILAYIVNVFVSSFFAIILSYIGFNPQTAASGGSGYDTFLKFLYGVFSVAILPALFEEFVHRGLVLRGTSDVVGYKSAIIISSLLFGLMHLNIQQFFYATILGLLMGFVATVSRSIWPAVIIHFCNNFINVFLSYAYSSNLFHFSFANLLNTIANQSVLLFFFTAIVIVSVAIIGIVYLVKKLFEQTGAKEYEQLFENIKQNVILSNGLDLTERQMAILVQQQLLLNVNASNIFAFYINDKSGARYGDLELKYRIPLITCFVLAGLVTMFTFIWGVV